MNSYFSHDSNARNSDKLLPLRMRLGAEGYGIYFMLLERLREENDYTSITDYNMLAFDFRVSSEKVKSVINDFGLFSFTDDGKRFYSEGFLDRMTKKDERKNKLSEAGKKGNEKRWGKKEEISPPDRHPIAEQSQEKKRKEKESKENNNTPSPPKNRGIKKNKNESGLNSKARFLFEGHFKDIFSTDYYWTAKDAGNMTSLLNALKYQRNQRGLENTDDGVLSALSSFLNSITDKWILEHYSVANINSKFNELVTQARNGTNWKNNKGNSDKSGFKNFTF